MKKLGRILRHEEKGFTLIELIVVIAILGIIAAIAVPQYMGTVNNARVKADIATAQNIADAAARYITDNCNSVSAANNVTFSTLTSGNYFTNVTPQSNPSGSFNVTVAQAKDSNNNIINNTVTITVSFDTNTSHNVTKNIEIIGQ